LSHTAETPKNPFVPLRLLPDDEKEQESQLPIVATQEYNRGTILTLLYNSTDIDRHFRAIGLGSSASFALVKEAKKHVQGLQVH
jgi:hypothetical protein